MKTYNNPKQETRYEDNIANGVQYRNQEEAIMANAKLYAKRAFPEVKEALESLGLTKEQIIIEAQKLLDRKVKVIENKIAQNKELSDSKSELPF